MMVGLLAFHHFLALVLLLRSFNRYLNGAMRKELDTLLTAFGFLLVVISPFLFGWKVGLFATCMSYVYAKLAKPLARSIIWKRRGRRSPYGFYDQGRVWALPGSVDQMLRRAQQTRDMIARVGRDRKILRVLDEYDKTAEDLEEIYRCLLRNCVGVELAREMIRSPDDLRLILELRNQGLGEARGTEFVFDMKFTLTLLKWPRPKLQAKLPCKNG